MQTPTKISFDDKWKNNPNLAFENTLNPHSEINKWIVERNGFNNLSEFKQHLSNKKRILDGGCGNGRVTALLRNITNITTQIVGIDFTSYEVAKENLKGSQNIAIYQKDLLDNLTDLGTFDFIYCQEVLHHTKNPLLGFQNLCDILAPDGEIAIYVYKKKAPAREFVDETIREKIFDKEYSEALLECRNITALGKTLSDLNIKIDVPEIKSLEIKAGTYDLQRFIYHHFMKCFWNNELSFEANSVINYDWYHPQLCSKHTIEEVREWFDKCGIKVIHEHVDFYGITVRGIKQK